MSKSKMIVVRVEESLLELLRVTSMILERKESETIRILLTRACKYWIARQKIYGKQDRIVTAVGEQNTSHELPIEDKEIKELEEAMRAMR